MPRQALLVLALMAALLGAPSVAYAGANALSSPSTTPTTGTTETAFVLRVEYEGQFPATGVTALVGRVALPMSLVAGSAASGMWSATTAMPAGTWPVTYTAAVLHGNVPSLSGGTLAVFDNATPPPTPLPTVVSNPPRTDAGGEPPASEDGGSAPAPAPAQAPAAVTPAPVPQAAPKSPDVAQTADDPPAGGAAPDDPVPGPGPSSQPAAAGDGGASPSDGSGSATAVPAGAPGTDEQPRDGIMAGTEAPRPDEGTAGPVSAGDDLLGMVLLLGLSGVGAVALVGSALLALGRRRETNQDPAPVSATLRPPVTREASQAATVSPRARRLARAKFGEDPILSSLGIGSDPRAGDARTAARRRRRPATKDGS